MDLEVEACLQVKPHGGIAVKASVVAAPSRMPRRSWLVLEYAEKENERGVIPSTETQFVNMYLVSGVERAAGGSLILKERYLVVDIWRYFPAVGLKTCHQWSLWEDAAGSTLAKGTMQLLVEDLNNRCLEERRQNIAAEQLEMMWIFYLKAKAFFEENVGVPPVEGNAATD